MRVYILILMAITTFCINGADCERVKTFEKFQEIRAIAVGLKHLCYEGSLHEPRPLDKPPIHCGATKKGLFLICEKFNCTYYELRSPWGHAFLGTFIKEQNKLFDELSERFDLKPVSNGLSLYVSSVYEIHSRPGSPGEIHLPSPVISPSPRNRAILKADYDRLVAK